jgi:hypothetical protein
MSEILKGLGNLIGRFGYGPELTDVTNQSFAVGSAPALVVHNTFGSIRVVTGEGGAIQVEATRHARGITSEAQQPTSTSSPLPARRRETPFMWTRG